MATNTAPSQYSDLPPGAVSLPDQPVQSAQSAPPQYSDLPAGAVSLPNQSTATPSGVGKFVRDVAAGLGPGSSVPGGPAETAFITGLPKTIWEALPPVQLVNSVKQILPLIHSYETARSNGSSMTDALTAVNETAKQHISNISPLPALIQSFRENPTKETVQALTHGVALAAGMFGGATGATPEAEAAAAPAAEAAETPSLLTRLTNPFRKAAAATRAAVTNPLASAPEAGEAVAQPIAQAGVKATAPTVGASLRSGIDVETPFKAAKNIYQVVDDAAKTDFKVLYDKLDAAQDAARVAAPGSPEEAVAQRNIKATEDSIADHKAIAEKSGVPNVDALLKQADAKFAETQANKDFNSKFFGNQGVISGNVAHGAPETINVDNAIDVLENFDKKNKFGISRLQQTSLGKDGAFKLKQVLYDAQKAGQTAMDSRALRNTILKLGGAGVGTALGLGYELSK